MMHGQTRVEFIFGVIIFVVIILYIVNQMNVVFSNAISDYGTDTLKAETNDIITVLIVDEGYPENWESIAQSNPGGVERIGLATQPYDLSKNKIANLSSNCSLMSNFVTNYRLKIYNSTDLILFCGTDTLTPSKVFVSKYVLIENDTGNITLELW